MDKEFPSAMKYQLKAMLTILIDDDQCFTCKIDLPAGTPLFRYSKFYDQKVSACATCTSKVLLGEAKKTVDYTELAVLPVSGSLKHVQDFIKRASEFYPLAAPYLFNRTSLNQGTLDAKKQFNVVLQYKSVSEETYNKVKAFASGWASRPNSSEE
jgi:hypothetical protein